MLKKLATLCCAVAFGLAMYSPTADACPGMEDKPAVAKKDKEKKKVADKKKAKKDKANKKKAKKDKEGKKVSRK